MDLPEIIAVANDPLAQPAAIIRALRDVAALRGAREQRCLNGPFDAIDSTALDMFIELEDLLFSRIMDRWPE